MSLKGGGTGLTLTAADHVFLVDPWWIPAAEDRAHRIGHEKPVFVYRLVAQGTVEEAAPAGTPHRDLAPPVRLRRSVAGTNAPASPQRRRLDAPPSRGGTAVEPARAQSHPDVLVGHREFLLRAARRDSPSATERILAGRT